MSTSRMLLPFVLTGALTVLVSSAQGGSAQTNSAVPITVIKYCLQPFRSFEIAGTDVKGVKSLRGLMKALRDHNQKNPGARYEILSEVKSVPSGEKEIVKAVAKAGITLEHYWAATSALPSPGEALGPHGMGYVDHIDQYRNVR